MLSYLQDKHFIFHTIFNDVSHKHMKKLTEILALVT